MDFAATHPVEQLRHLVRQRNLLSLHKEDSFVLERTGPVHVNLELAANVLRDDQQLRETCQQHNEIAWLLSKRYLVKKFNEEKVRIPPLPRPCFLGQTTLMSNVIFVGWKEGEVDLTQAKSIIVSNDISVDWIHFFYCSCLDPQSCARIPSDRPIWRVCSISLASVASSSRCSPRWRRACWSELVIILEKKI